MAAAEVVAAAAVDAAHQDLQRAAVAGAQRVAELEALDVTYHASADSSEQRRRWFSRGAAGREGGAAGRAHR